MKSKEREIIHAAKLSVDSILVIVQALDLRKVKIEKEQWVQYKDIKNIVGKSQNNGAPLGISLAARLVLR